ncbi:eCIS core domain-containing protein [Aquiflexum lacus]|uniref:eCIS core domain-containing protein n=1 Tax=Aquiflexum lacus TaxID=2483805 RepID=UPI00189432C7|nr:DUF4157 domain-containing protein [Aquiflexum lacus]
MALALDISTSNYPKPQKAPGRINVQPTLKVGAVNDKYEQEANSVADKVIQWNGPQEPSVSSTPPNPIQMAPLLEEGIQMSTEEEEMVQMMPGGESLFMGTGAEEEETIKMKPIVQSNAGGMQLNSNTSSQILAKKGGGSSLPKSVGTEMGYKIGADFSGVRVHNDSTAASISDQIGAKAFTHGNDVFFNQGQFQPHTNEGKHLIAHELTHTVQQGAVVRMSPQQPISQTEPKVQRLPWAAREGLARFSNFIPGYGLMTLIIGYDPIAGRNVERNGPNLLQGLLGLIPVFGTLLFNKLSELNIIENAFSWVQAEMSSLNLSAARLDSTLQQAWDEMSILSGWDANIRILERTFGQLFRDIVSFAGRVKDKVFELIKDALMAGLRLLADRFPGYPLLTKLLGSDPLTGEEVTSTTAEKIEDFLILIGKEKELEKMKEEGTLQETAAWIDTELANLNFSFAEIKSLFESAWNAFSLDDLRNPLVAFTRTIAIFEPFTTRVFVLAVNVAIKVLEIIKKALMSQLSEFAREQQGFHLMTVILGQDPFTDEVVERNPENVIRGFMGLLPGGEEQFQQMKQTGAIEQTTSRIDAAVEELGFTVQYIVGLFIGLWDSFTIDDVFNPFGAFVRIIETLSSPILRLFDFIVRIVRIIVEVLLVIMNFPIDTINSIIANAAQAFEDIKNDPIGFIKNLLRAVKQGFVQFFENILNHLLGGLRDWLFGELATAGIDPPTDMSFQSILDFVLNVLGITMENIWSRLALKIGQERVDQIRGALDRLSGIWTFIKDVWERGPIAIWEYVQEQLSNLWNMVVEQVKNWTITRIIQQVTARILSMLDPSGIMAVVNSFIAFYRAVQSFIEKLRAMLEIVNSFVAGVANIARGSIGDAANYLENAMARAIPVIIGFLANQVGLRGLGEKVGEMIEALREKVNAAIDWLIDKALSAGGALMQMGRDAADSILGWLGFRKRFTLANGEQHEVFFQDESEEADIMVASRDPKTLKKILADKEWNGKSISSNYLKKLQAHSKKIDENRHGQGINKGEIIKEEFGKIVDILQKIGGVPIPSTTIPEKNTIGSGKYLMGAHLNATTLSLDPGGYAGSEPSIKTGLGEVLKAKYPNYIVEGHLLNHKLHGPGNTGWNLTPISKKTNSNMNKILERKAKNAVLSEGSIVQYEVEVRYKNTLDESKVELEPEKYIADKLILKLKELEYGEDGEWKSKPEADQPGWAKEASKEIPHDTSTIPNFEE